MASTIETMLNRLFGTARRPSGSASGRPRFTRNIKLAGPVVEWCASEVRCGSELALFADLLLCLDADPFLAESRPLLPHAGLRWFAPGTPPRFKVIYHVDPALNLVRVLTCTPVLT